MWCHNAGIFLFLVAMVDMGWMQFAQLDAITMAIQLIIVATLTVYAIVLMREEFSYSESTVMDKHGNFRNMDDLEKMRRNEANHYAEEGNPHY
jgi:hypothetical protein